MRKQTKIAAVVSAAALLALGASITSFAAAKGTWMMVDGEWYCYDKNGDVYENTFCSSNGKEYYVGDDGMLVRSSWVEYDGDYYFVNSSGAKIVNDWRLTTPYEDEDADEEWFYFQSTGKRADNKKILYKGSTFFFDADGKMLTGWVAEFDNKTADKDDDYYIEIDGETEYYAVNNENIADVYYCLYDEDKADGHVQKNKWIKTWRPEDAYDEDEDEDKFWYWVEKDGKVYIPEKADADAYKYALGDGSLEIKNKGKQFGIAKKKINSKDYFFNMAGEMVNNFIDVVKTGDDDVIDLGMHYFGGSDDGSMKTGSQSIKDDNGDTYKFYFGTKDSGNEKKGVGITGNKNNKLYYEGHLVVAQDYKYQTVDFIIDKKESTFIVNQNGSIQHSAVEYKEDGDVLINAKAAKYNTTTGANKYSVEDVNKLIVNVEEIDETSVMAISGTFNASESVVPSSSGAGK